MSAQPVEGGKLVIWMCVDCKRPGSLTLPLVTLPNDTLICEDCQRRREGALAKKGAAGEEKAAARLPAPRGSYYDVLGVPFDARPEEINAALKERMKHWLARQTGDERDKAVEMLAKLRTVSQELKDPDRRQKYDKGLHQQLNTLRAAAIQRVAPFEDWPGRQVISLKGLIQACEDSSTNWKIGEQLLTNKQLIWWIRYGLADDDTVRLIEQVLSRQNLSTFRKLNEVLYRFDPERPFRFFRDPELFDPVTNAMSVTDVKSLIDFADANWALAVRHLYQGELITWLNYSLSPAGYYEGRRYHHMVQFFDEVCRPFADSHLQGVGLEALLEFLSPLLAKPEITVTFDQQHSAYTLLGWDQELPHQPVTLSIKNRTRGYFAGMVELLPPGKKQTPPSPWASFTPLPLAPDPLKPQTGLKTQAFSLTGAEEQRFSLYLGNFKKFPQGRKYLQPLGLARYITQSAQPTPRDSFPITLGLMPYRAGYRGKLWAQGLRGGFPGLLLDGGIGFGVGLLIFVLGLLLTPHDSNWGFLQDFRHGLSLALVIDLILIALLRPLYLAIAIFGFGFSCMLAGAFAACGFFTAWRRGHSTYTSTHDQNAHGFFGLLVMLGLLAATVLFFFSKPGFFTHQSPFFDILAILMPSFFAYITVGIIVRVRTNLYKRTEKRWGSLLKPEGKAEI